METAGSPQAFPFCWGEVKQDVVARWGEEMSCICAGPKKTTPLGGHTGIRNPWGGRVSRGASTPDA